MRSVRAGADDANELVDVGDGNRQADQDMGLVAGVAEQLLRAARNDFLAEVHEGADHVLQVHQLRAAAVERQHVHAE